jgi:hypothetical protein
MRGTQAMLLRARWYTVMLVRSAAIERGQRSKELPAPIIALKHVMAIGRLR